MLAPAAELPTPTAEPSFMGMPDTFTPVYWTADMASPRTATATRWSTAARALDWSAVHDLLLVAEVLSPSTPRHDRFTKRRRYQEAGVPLYWIIDGDGRQAEVWTPHDAFPRIERDRLVWQPEGAAAPFTMPLQELFRAIE
jgi:Uma2 family endonuclease